MTAPKAAAPRVAIVSLPVDAWEAVLIQIQWEDAPELRQATAVIRNAVAEAEVAR